MYRTSYVNMDNAIIWYKNTIFMMSYRLRFIDLFAGLGGMRLGFEEAARSIGIETECVLTGV
jgi:C-5 cytosine-specific DNA methylase